MLGLSRFCYYVGINSVYQTHKLCILPRMLSSIAGSRWLMLTSPEVWYQQYSSTQEQNDKQGKTGRLAKFKAIKKSNKLRYRQSKHKREKQESPWFNMSKDGDDDDAKSSFKALPATIHLSHLAYVPLLRWDYLDPVTTLGLTRFIRPTNCVWPQKNRYTLGLTHIGPSSLT